MQCPMCGAENTGEAVYCWLCWDELPGEHLSPVRPPYRGVTRLRFFRAPTDAEVAIACFVFFLVLMTVVMSITVYHEAEYWGSPPDTALIAVAIQVFGLFVVSGMVVWAFVFPRRSRLYTGYGQRMWDANAISRLSGVLVAKPARTCLALVIALELDVYITRAAYWHDWRVGLPEIVIALALPIALAVGVYLESQSGFVDLVVLSDARHVDPDEYVDSFEALGDMAAASGIPRPDLYVYKSNGVNAWVAGHVGTSYVALSSAMVEQFTKDEQRAVCANLVARIAMGSSTGSPGPSSDTAFDFRLQLLPETHVLADEAALVALRDSASLLSALRKTASASTLFRHSTNKSAYVRHLWAVPRDARTPDDRTFEADRIARIEALIRP